MSEEPLFNKTELGRLLRVSARTIDRRRSAGEILKPLGGRGRPRWSPSEVREWIEAGCPRADVWARHNSRRG